MSGSTFGKIFRVTTWGESHGKAIGAVVDGCPAGLSLSGEDIQKFLDLPRFAGCTDLEFCEWMIKNIGVAAVPGSSFFKEEVNHLIRLHFAREKETIDEAISRLGKLQELLS